VLTYKIARIIYNHRIAFISAFLFAIHGLIIEVGSGRVATDHVDLFFLFFIELSVYWALLYATKQRRIYNLFFSFSLGAALLSKYMPALIVLPVWLLFALENKKITKKELLIQFTLIVSLVALIVLPWQIYIHLKFPLESVWESHYNFRHLTEVIEEQTGGWFYHFSRMRIIYGELIYIPVIRFTYKTFRNSKNLKRYGILIWIWVPFLFFSFARTKMQGYTLFAAPALFMVTALFWEYLYRFRKRIRYKWLTYSLLVLLIGLPVRYSIERIKPFNEIERAPEWVGQIKALNKVPHSPKAVIFNVKRPIETMFYTDFVAYRNYPEMADISKLKEQGYDIFLANDSTFLSEDKRIKHLSFKE
jgi:4-amino-4-deoxy-L-arabinose transferase